MSFNKLSVIAAFGLLAFASNAFAFNGTEKVIYGKDDRLNVYEVSDAAVIAAARSTAALFKASSVRIDQGRSVGTLSVQKFGTALSLCKDERFFDENMGAFCSGSLVGPDLFMTAGHCITDDSGCANTKIVFDFAVKQAGVYPTEVPSSSVYSCKKIVSRRQDPGAGVDYAIIQLDRAVTDRAPLKLARNSNLSVGSQITVIGHPVGLPTKISGGASVRELKNGFFVANLDTYGGNSGSAVFNNLTGEVEGILVRGENDFVTRRDANGVCRASNFCSDTGCRGEDSTSVSNVLPFVPAN